MISIAVINQKGGVGKTTSVVNLAACLEKDKKKKVLVIDCDSQCNATSYLTTFFDDCEYDICDCIKGECSIDEAIMRVQMEWFGKVSDTNMYLVKGNTQMDTAPITDENVFGELTEGLKGYDYLFYDCPANLTAPTLAALTAADFVLIPAEPDMDSLGGYSLLLDTVQAIRTTSNVGLKILGIFFTKVSAHAALDKYLFEQNRTALGDEIFKTYIRNTTVVPQARFMGKPVTYYKATSDVAGDYRALAGEMEKRIRKFRSNKA